jgi:hypothetical protein
MLPFFLVEFTVSLDIFSRVWMYLVMAVMTRRHGGACCGRVLVWMGHTLSVGSDWLRVKS